MKSIPPIFFALLFFACCSSPRLLFVSGLVVGSAMSVFSQKGTKFAKYNDHQSATMHMTSGRSSSANDAAAMEETSITLVARRTKDTDEEQLVTIRPCVKLSSQIQGRQQDSVAEPIVHKSEGTKDWWIIWTKRLITSEDAFSIHKLSALVYTVTSFTMMGTGCARWLVGRQDLFATIPDFVEPVMYLFCLSNLSMCMASIRMAHVHRRNDLASRNAFIGTAGSSIFSAYFLLWASPFVPEFLTTHLASQIGFGILCAWNVLFVADTMIRAKEIIDGRRDNKSENENASYALEYLRYIAAGAWGLPVVVATGYISSVIHDHSWLINVFDYVTDTYGHGMQASVFFNNVMASMAAAYGSLFVTLRDKKLISKQTEWTGIAVFAIPALVWTIDVSARIFPYWTGGVELVF